MHMIDQTASMKPAGADDGAGSAGRGDSQVSRGGRHAGSARSVQSLLEGGHGTAAARALMAGLSRGAFSDHLSVGEWLAALNPQQHATLLSGFAHYPCFACRNGQETCDACTGSGFTAVARVCGTCIGLGTKRCDFCGGTGLATYNAIPTELWLGVIASRAGRAVKLIEKFPALNPAALGEPAVVARLQDVNKLLGVLENALAAARQLVALGAVEPEVAQELVEVYAAPVAAGVTFMRRAMRVVADHCRQNARTLTDVDADNAEAKAEFYEELAQSASFDGSGAAHPLLPLHMPA
jgi:hypothetical protein